MDIDNKITNILKEYVEVEDAKMQAILSKVKKELPPAKINASKEKVLRNIELHQIASDVIEDEVLKFREDLYLFSRKVASRELEENIITKAHVIKAREFLWRRKKKYDFADGYLGIGGVLAGTGIPHVIELIKNSSEVTPNPTLIILSIIGGFLLGMGIISKAKQ